MKKMFFFVDFIIFPILDNLIGLKVQSEYSGLYLAIRTILCNFFQIVCIETQRNSESQSYITHYFSSMLCFGVLQRYHFPEGP